jgi:prepilin-type N-terminal cleavage/methylation domain-containing protein
MKMKLKLKQRQSGFTIIEVVIVLAIAALIMVVIFLAVPALQRSQRNNARKTDANRIAAAVIEFQSNSATGALPGASDCGSLKTSFGTLGSYNLATCTAQSSAAITTDNAVDTMYLVYGTASPSTANTPTGGTVIVAEGASCSGTSAVVAGSSANSVAVLYSLESGGSWTWACRNAQ